MSSKVLVVAEAYEGALRPISTEMISAAQAVAAAVDGEVVALVVGSDLEAAAAQVASLGVSRVLAASDEGLKYLPTLGLASVVSAAIQQEQPFAVIVPSTTAGIEYAPRVAARLDLPLASDCIGLAVDGGKLVAIRPILGGRVQSAVTIESGSTAIVTVRQGSFKPAVASGSAAPITPFQVTLSDGDDRASVTGVSEKETGGVGLDTAKVIVGGGRGLKEPANFKLVEELAAALHGAVAATRAVTDAGWRPHNEQIGQTGRVVSPELYIAVGISGAAQHVAGLQGAENIVAINRDPDAPIFKIASFGIVGDLFEVVPAVIAELKASA